MTFFKVETGSVADGLHTVCDIEQIQQHSIYKFCKTQKNTMTPRCNELLSAIPDHEFNAMTSHMQLVSLVKGQTLFEAGQTPQTVHYPVGAIVSMMLELRDGFSVETHMFGQSCMVGVGAIGMPSFYSAKVRRSGLAYRLSVAHLQQARQTCPAYVSSSHQAMQRMFRQLSLAIICGKRHSVEQQLARWMLSTLDRTPSDTIPITHLELSDLLGFRREAVTLALGKFCDTGLVACGRGQLSVLDRRRLEKLSCDCYWLGQDRPAP